MYDKFKIELVKFYTFLLNIFLQKQDNQDNMIKIMYCDRKNLFKIIKPFKITAFNDKLSIYMKQSKNVHKTTTLFK